MRLVSVVVPCYNYARYLPASVASALGQAGVDVQVILVDDASTDDSRHVAAELRDRDARIKLICHTSNLGPVQTFNDGLAHVEGEFVVRLDADDLLTPGSLVRAIMLMEAAPEVGFVYGHPRHFSGEAPPPPRTKVTSWSLWPGREWLERRCRSGYNCITSPEVVMRRSVVDKVGGQRNLPHGHDMEMWLRLASVADVGRVNGPDQAFHRDHAQSLSALQVSVLSDLVERRLVFDVLFTQGGVEPALSSSLHGLARRTLAREALGLAAHEFDRGRGSSDVVSAYIDFAATTVKDVCSLPEWRGLARRQALGARWVPLLPPFLAHAVARRVRADVARWRWHQIGI